jgi:hypothetical protein
MDIEPHTCDTVRRLRTSTFNEARDPEGGGGARLIPLGGAGHSLGGALATLAAYDIAHMGAAEGQARISPMVYSFGSPRTGPCPSL